MYQLMLRLAIAAWFLVHSVCSTSFSQTELSELDELKWDKRLQYHEALYRRKLQQVTIPPTNDFRKHHNSTHPHPWQILAEVNGVKNQDVAILVLSTGKDDESYLRDRILPSARTWMRFFANVFVIEEDNFKQRTVLRHCSMENFPHFTTFSCHNEPTYVLTRKCTNEYYGAKGPCCKMDEIVNYLTENTALWSHLKYVFHCDDDTFFRPDQVMKWLSIVEKSGISDKLPLVGNVDHSRHDLGNPGVWHITECKEIHTLGWYQPMFLNKKALDLIAVAAKDYGHQDECRHFEVTLDVGFGVIAWLYGLHHIKIPGTEINPGHLGQQIFNPHQMIVHGIRHIGEDDCNGEKWPDEVKYDQLSATGCGRLDKPGPFHNKDHDADMYDAWLYFATHGQDVQMNAGENGLIQNPNNATEIIPDTQILSGYSTTSHARKYDITKKWHEFALSDCNPKGSISKRRARKLSDDLHHNLRENVFK